MNNHLKDLLRLKSFPDGVNIPNIAEQGNIVLREFELAHTVYKIEKSVEGTGLYDAAAADSYENKSDI